ncbi:MAG: hypothetical protein WDO16_18250 [Bacteroidota bacterium]
MRKLYFFLPAVLFVCLSSNSQSPVYKITHSYFRSDPFETTFSAFVSHLLNDPALTDKVLEKKTDTSLFLFRAYYKNYNPFFFKPKKVEVVLTETPVSLDSLNADTIYTYQLRAFTNDTKEGAAELKKEFEKIYRRHKGSFNKTSYTESQPGSRLPSATYNFFDPLHGVAPFAVTWAGPNADKEMCLIITIRLSTHGNKAILPIPFYAL